MCQNDPDEYTEIFDEIVTIMHNDYAGKDEKVGWDRPQEIRSKLFKLSKTLDETSFFDLVDEYLDDFDDRHILWRLKKSYLKTLGFTVRRYRDSLYVNKVAGPHVELELGTKIVEIDDSSIPYHQEIHAKKLKNIPDERQNWRPILDRASNVTVEYKNGDTVSKKLTKQEPKPAERSPYEIKPLDQNTLLFRLDDFNRPDDILELIHENRELLDDTPYWIIDVRNNNGGSDSAYGPILPYIFSKDEKIINEPVYFLMSERNCDLRIEILNEFMEHGSQKPETRKLIQDYIDDIERNRGKGFVKSEEPMEIVFEETLENPKKIVVLTDVYCSSSGDQFVHEVKQADKVHVMGRPTLGVLDYSNLARISFKERFELWYPTSKTENVLRGEFTKGGITPDTYVPWTPEHLEDDIDMKMAMEYLHG